MHNEKMLAVVGSGFCILNSESLNPVIQPRYLPLLIPNIPILQHSIIPAGIYGRTHPFGMTPKSDPPDPDSLLLNEFDWL